MFLTQFQRLYYLLDSRIIRQLPVLFALFISLSLMNIVSLGLVGIFLLMIINVKHFLSHLPFWLQEYASHFNKKELIIFSGVSLIVAYVIKAIMTLYSQKRIGIITNEYASRLKIFLMQTYQETSYEFFLTSNPRDIFAKIMLADSFAKKLLQTLLDICSSLLVLSGILTLLFFTSPMMSIMFLAFVALIFSLHYFFFQKIIVRSENLNFHAQQKISKTISSVFQGLKEIRVLKKEKYFLSFFRWQLSILDNELVRTSMLQIAPKLVIECVLGVFFVIYLIYLTLFGVNLVTILPQCAIFLATCVRVLPMFINLMRKLNKVTAGLVAMNRLYDECRAIQTRYKACLEDHHNKLVFETFGVVGVGFKYPSLNKVVFSDLNMTIRKGELFGIAGPSGIGKSTLANLILGLLRPSEGSVVADNVPICDGRAWLNNFAYIPQHIFIMNDTLKNNIALGVKPSEINIDQLNTAISLSMLSSLVDGLPNGFDTIIGEDGLMLSGGQRQRLAIARALYFDREIIVMDEATSALDNKTEQDLMHCIKSISKTKTIVIIAHRFSTLQFCDRVYSFVHKKTLTRNELIMENSEYIESDFNYLGCEPSVHPAINNSLGH